MKLIPFNNSVGGSLKNGSNNVGYLILEGNNILFYPSVDKTLYNRQDLSDILFYIDKLEAKYGQNKTV